MEDDTLENIINQLPDVDKKKARNLLKLDESKDLALLEELQAINESLKAIAEKEMPEMEMPEVHKVQIDGLETITLKGDPGRNPLSVSDTEPINPQIGDLWYQP